MAEVKDKGLLEQGDGLETTGLLVEEGVDGLAPLTVMDFLSSPDAAIARGCKRPLKPGHEAKYADNIDSVRRLGHSDIAAAVRHHTR